MASPNNKWNDVETEALLQFTADEGTQHSLNSMVHNKDIYLRIAKEFTDADWS